MKPLWCGHSFFDTPTTKPATERAELEELRRVGGVGDDRDTLVTGRVLWRRGVRPDRGSRLSPSQCSNST